ncbi:SGNH hydrolase domain-containing protein [Paraburkholderia sp. BL21I4N1]|uniref:SGNH hydrolase domain-containing protein n=1 Tax=Paraburkholderia sp. BL21I4N1 TaxID=1938801 RepID=UPI0035BE97EA
MVDQLTACHLDLTVYNPASVLCDSQRNVCPMTMNGKYLYSYGDHMSDYANGLIAERFLSLVER